MQIPGYRVIRKINQGGMSTVYLAIQKSVGREVALKVMSPALNADPVFSERFQREANIVGQLSHPNIIAIYDIGCHQNLNYIAMDYLPGGTIHDKMKAGMTTEEVLKIVKEIAVALNVAHNKWFVHRDIKPENILFRADGTAVLTDFGVAKAVSSSSSVTNSGTVVGTPYYMSPEQARGKTLDRRSDLYSLGIVFYEMLTGTVPFKADEVVAIAIKHLTQPVPNLPPQYAIYQSILEKLLAKSPDDRFQSGSELVTAIETIQSTLSGIPNNPSNYTDPSSMGVMALFKALVFTSYAALKLQAKKLLEKILKWRWTPNRGFYKRPTVKVTEIRTESNNDDEHRETIVSTRIQKAAHFEESLGSKFSYITRTFTWIFILSIIWSSFSVGMVRIDAHHSKMIPVIVSDAMLSTAGVIEGYTNKVVGEPEIQHTAKPNLEMLSYQPERKPSPTADDLLEQEMAALEQMSLERYNSDVGNYEIVSPVSDEQFSDTQLAADLIDNSNGDSGNNSINNNLIASDVASIDQISDDLTSDTLSLAENNLDNITEESLSTSIEDGTDSNEVTENTVTSEAEVKPATAPKPAPKPTYALTVNTKPEDARVRILNIRAKYRDGIKLQNGRYKIEVSKKGYGTIVQNVRLRNKPLTLKYVLRKDIRVGDSIIDTLQVGGKSPEMVIIPRGTFVMGDKDERHLSPERKVRIQQQLAVSKYEVTFDDYEKFAKATNRSIPKDNRFGKGNRPVINVNWNNAVAYAEWLSKQTGETYRLPSESEWEYFSRAGVNAKFWWGNQATGAIDKANCKKGCGDKASKTFKNKTAPVGSFSSNPFLLFDTAGNVAEWTQDCFQNNYEGAPINGDPVAANSCKKRTVRGGSYKDSVSGISGVERKGVRTNVTEEYIGFRVVREIKDS